VTRSLIPDLASPVPIASTLPEIFRTYDDRLIELTEALDEVIAPVWMVLDCFDAYLDPTTAPLDFVHMLAGWLGFPVDHNWSESQTRRLVASAIQLHRSTGTVEGLRRLVTAYTGVEPEISDSGGSIWSSTAGADQPGSADPAVSVLVELPEGQALDGARLSRFIAANLPAHVAVSVDVRRGAKTAAAVTDLGPDDEDEADEVSPAEAADPEGENDP
jgi:phage tail-like protein